MNLYDSLTDIHALEAELFEFERKYGIRSETLYAAYIEGEEPKDYELFLHTITEQFPDVCRPTEISVSAIGGKAVGSRM